MDLGRQVECRSLGKGYILVHLICITFALDAFFHDILSWILRMRKELHRLRYARGSMSVPLLLRQLRILRGSLNISNSTASCALSKSSQGSRHSGRVAAFHRRSAVNSSSCRSRSEAVRGSVTLTTISHERHVHRKSSASPELAGFQSL